jgi:Xaa-Pro aminopeptidase
MSAIQEGVASGFVPRFSVAERDHRWARVRKFMAEADIDALFVPPNTGFFDQFQANLRYLTGLGGNNCQLAAIFPASGEVTAITSPDVDRSIWMERQDWVNDIRMIGSGWGYAQLAIERLKELGLTRARIGLPGLSGNTRYPEGVFSHGMYEVLRTELPDAELVNANPLLERARFVKSAEEIAFMQRAVGLAERALETFAAESRPGVPECVVYGRMLSTMVERGGEIPTMILWSVGWPQPKSNSYMPTSRPMQRGDMIVMELEGRWAGYIGQVTQAAFLGDVPAEYDRMFEIQQQALQRCYELLRPGAIIGDFVDACVPFNSEEFSCQLIMHARGLGDDSPICVYQPRDETMRTWEIEANSTFIIKPVITRRDGSAFRRLLWGDTVVATDAGARRLGGRIPQIMRLTA